MALHMSTIVSRKASDILNHLSQLRPAFSSNPLLYTISVSQNINSADLSRLVSSVKSLSHNSVGCLSASIPSSQPSWQEQFAISLASFDGKHATLFRSTIPGQKAVQVGRWHAFHQKDKEPDTRDYSQHIDWETAMSNTYGTKTLPPALQPLSPQVVTSVVYLSDNAPEGLSSALSVFNSATKLGLIATSTPFVTGRPYTLFHNDAIYSDGAVGVCLTSPLPVAVQTEFPGLEAITRPMIVTSSEGNMVNALDNANPSRLLLHAIQNHPAVSSYANQNTAKELQLYLGTIAQRDGKHELDQLFHITSGDPSRGSIALDTDAAPPEGTLVQMYVLPPGVNPDVLGEVQRQFGASRSLTFSSTSLDDLNAQPSALDGSRPVADTMILADTFLAASENGCLISRAAEGKSERSWKCVVPGGVIGLHW